MYPHVSAPSSILFWFSVSLGGLGGLFGGFFPIFIKKANKPVFVDQKLSPNYRML